MDEGLAMDTVPIPRPIVATFTGTEVISAVVPQLEPPCETALTLTSHVPFISVLYICAGEHRKSDVGYLLSSMQIAGKAVVKVLEVDLLRSPEHDVTVAAFWNSIIIQIKDRMWAVVVVTPPCNTHSRARNANHAGPPPVRSKAFPYGYPWLSGLHLQEVTLANHFIDITFEACEAAFSVGAAFLIQHPEDLGATSDFQQPASIFGITEMHALVKRTRAKTAAFHQCPWGAPSSKPTRVVSTLDLKNPEDDNVLYYTWPIFDKWGTYKGPLPRNCGHRHQGLLGRRPSGRNAGSFRTSGSASYPANMCKWIVDMIFRFCVESAATFSCQPKVGAGPAASVSVPASSDSQRFPPVPWELTKSAKLAPAMAALEDPIASVETPEEEIPSSSEDEEGLKKPLLKDHLPGFGPPLSAVWSGKKRELHDGGGLCSPGRWLPPRRKICSWKPLRSVSERLSALLLKSLGEPAKVCLKLACGKSSDSPFPDELIAEGRLLLAEEIAKDSVFSVDQLLEIQQDQPFLLRLLGEGLRLMNDPDWRIFYAAKGENFWHGVSVGPGTKMPRTPAVFERKTKFRKYDETEFLAEVSNYKSAAGAKMSAVLEQQFISEETLGMMYKTSLAAAKRDFKDLRIAAQGAIEKGDDSWRILHDATHHVRVNNETTIRDQIRMPAAADARSIMQESAEHDSGVHFSLQFDVSKAHRRYLHKKSDWGLMGCRSDDVQETLWINKVGTFGFTCASYWWGRLAAGITRFVIRFFEQRWIIQLLFADDNRLQANGVTKFGDILLAIFLWVIIGTPLAWHKCKGGLSCEWVGYLVDYGRFAIGIADSRVQWLVKWGTRVVRDGLVQMRDFAEGLGRLGFCSGVLEYYKPFLAPLYSWSSAAPSGAVLPVPPMVRLTLSWIVKQLEQGRTTTLCKKASKDLGVLFKTDAKGEETYVVLGGWECRGNSSTTESRWFSITLTIDEVPWLFNKGHGSRTIAASELLATLLAVHLFVPLPSEPPLPTSGTILAQGLTDNQSNMYVVAKLMTTTYPLAAVLMQLTCMLSQRNLWLNLGWVRRTLNVEADALTNSDFSLFNPDKRMEIIWKDVPLEVMASLLEEGNGFLAEIERLRENKKRDQALTGNVVRKRRRVKTPW